MKTFHEIVDEVRGSVRECTVHDVRRRMEAGEKLCLVDVREDSEWAAFRIPGAIHLGRGILERDAAATLTDPDAEIILYCGGGYRSVLAARALAGMGYTGTVSMDGGVRGWRDAGYPFDE